MKLALKWYTSIVHEIMFSCIFQGNRVQFLARQTIKIEKKDFLALIPCFHYDLLQKTLRPLGSDDITKNLPHTFYPYFYIQI